MRSTSTIMVRLYLVILSLTLAIAQIFKEPSGDLLNYFARYESLYNDFTGYFSYTRNYFDLLFYVPSGILAHLSSGSHEAFVFFWSLLVYVFILASVVRACENRNHNYLISIALVTYAGFVGISFEVVTHLLRQYVAVSLLVFGVVFFAEKRFKLLGLFTASALVHYQFLLMFGSLLVKRYWLFVAKDSSMAARVTFSTLILVFLLLAYALGAELPPVLSYFCSAIPEHNLFLGLCNRAGGYFEPSSDGGFLSFRHFISTWVVYVVFLLVFIKRGLSQSEGLILLVATSLMAAHLAFSFSTIASERLFMALSMFSLIMIPSILPRSREVFFLVLVLLLGFTAVLRWLRADPLGIFLLGV